MAEVIVGAFAEPFLSRVIEKLGQVLQHVTSFRKEFRWLCDELAMIRCFLDDTANNTTNNLSSLNNWVQKLEDVLCDAQDILEECEPHKFRDFRFRLRTGRKIKEIKERIRGIHEQTTYLNIVHQVNDSSWGSSHSTSIDSHFSLQRNEFRWRRSKPSVPSADAQIVGADENLTTLKFWLIDDYDATVIGVVGMGGVGKTLLVQHVFNSREVQERFEYLIWLPVSQKFCVRELQGLIGRKICKNLDADTVEEEAAAVIYRHLQGKRVLVVLDDVWSRDTDDNEDNVHSVVELIGLPVDNRGKSCKIVITTRNIAITTSMNANRILKVKVLNQADSWKLFCIHAFRDSNNMSPSHLLQIARDIENKLGGLPLAIKTVAASLTDKRNREQWKYVLHQLRGNNTLYGADKLGTAKELMRSLVLSYNSLPSVLRPCFLYCCVFPEDAEIDCENLIQLWIAEGLVFQQDPSFLLAEGRLYLNALIDRCLIEVSNLGKDGKVESCKMHDMLRDLALFISESSCRCLFLAGKDIRDFPPSEGESPVKCRRISLIQNRICSIPRNTSFPSLRTLLLSHNQELAEIPSRFSSNFRSLRVLDLSYTSLNTVPISLAKLKHLVLLRLSNTKICELPESVSSLRRLEHLDMNGCRNLKRLPSRLGEIKTMRHLNMSNCPQLEILPAEISKLICLQVLEGCSIQKQKPGTLQLEGLRGLTKLQCLSLQCDCFPYNLFANMRNMQKLKLVNMWSRCSEPLPEDMQVMEELEQVSLRLFLLPTWICTIKNLRVLQLKQCNCADFPALETLPRLLDLDITFNKGCRKLRNEFGYAKAFPQLERMSLRYFETLEEMPRIEKGAMARLKSLDVSKCKRLKRLPPGIERLSSLQVVIVSRCEALKGRIKEGGEDWLILRNLLPSVKLIDR